MATQTWEERLISLEKERLEMKSRMDSLMERLDHREKVISPDEVLKEQGLKVMQSLTQRMTSLEKGQTEIKDRLNHHNQDKFNPLVNRVAGLEKVVKDINNARGATREHLKLHSDQMDKLQERVDFLDKVIETSAENILTDVHRVARLEDCITRLESLVTPLENT